VTAGGNGKAPTTLREQLARKRAARRKVQLPLGPEGERAQGDLDQAKQAMQIAQLTGNADAIQKARNWERRAQRALDKHSTTIVVRGLSEEERDALNSAHPATAEQIAEDDAAIKNKEMGEDERRSINKATWLPAALELVVVDSDLTEAEWATELAEPGKWTAGEKNALLTAVVRATQEGPAPGIPFA
jgi:hypothetical protein